VDVGASTSKKTLSNHREKSATPSQESIRSTNPDPKAYEIFTGYLLRGHIDEAVNYAVNQSLHTDAMILVRRIFAGNEKKLADIEARFLATRPSSNPVMTLVAVASGEPAPVLVRMSFVLVKFYFRPLLLLSMLELGDRMQLSFWPT
jgi:hypothetical protein